MTEPIIINGVDVSGCVSFRDDVFTNKQLENVCSIGLWQKHYQNLEENCVMSCNCKDNPNCYYKQLQRANYQIAEDENLQCDMREKIDELSELLKCKTAECEELQEELTQEKLRNDDCYGQFKELRNKLQIATEALKAIQNNCKNIDVSLVLEQIESEEQ